MWLSDVKMRWQFGGNLQPVRMICEFDWSECPIAIANYLWSEIVTDVVDCLTNEAILWRIIAMLFVSTILLHTVCCKTRWVNETSLTKESLNRVDFKVRDLELKVNVLTYKMQYGTWPLPHQVQAIGMDEPLKVRLTLSNGNQKNGWIKRLMPSPEWDSVRVPYPKAGPRSAHCLKKLLDLETKYVSSRFQQRDISPIESNVAGSSKTGSERSTGYSKRNVRSAEKKYLKQRQMSKSENLELRHRGLKFGLRFGTERVNCSSETQTRNGTKFTGSSNKARPHEQLTKISSNCKRFMEKLKSSNRSLGLTESSSRINELNSTKNVYRGSQSEQQNHFVNMTSDVDKSTDGQENYLNTSNNVLSIAKLNRIKLHRLPVEDPIYSSVEDCVFQSSKPKLLPSSLSINFPRASMTNEVPEASIEVRQRENLGNPTSENLHQVRQKLESLHKVLQNYEAQDTRKCSTRTLEELTNGRNKEMDTIFQNVNNFENGYDGIMSAITIDINQQGNLRNKHAVSNEYEQCDNEQTVRSSLSSISIQNYTNIFDVQREDFAPVKKITKSMLMDHVEQSPSIEWIHEEPQNSKNSDKDNTTYTRMLYNDDLIDKIEIRDYSDISNDVSNEKCKKTKSSDFQEATNDEKTPSMSNSLTSDSFERDNFLGKTPPKSKSRIEFPKNSTLDVCEVNSFESCCNDKKHIESYVSSDDISECLLSMEMEDDLIAISRTSSQTEFSKESDFDDKSTATLLREALKFKKALLSQIELNNEVDLAQEQKMTKENSECESNDGTKIKTDNQLQSKLLDIISEEQSASSSTEKTSKIPMKTSKEKKLSSFSKVDEHTINNINYEERTCNVNDLEGENHEDPKLISVSSEYFSLSNIVDDKDINMQAMRNSSSSKLKLSQSRRNINNNPVKKSKTMLKRVTGSPMSEAEKINRVEEPVLTINKVEEKSVKLDKDANDGRIMKTEKVAEKIIKDLNKDEIRKLKCTNEIKNLNNNMDDISIHDDNPEEWQAVKAFEDTGSIKNDNECANRGQNSETHIDNSTQRVKNIDELVLQNVQNMRNYTEIFSRDQNNAILQTRKALLQQKEVWNLNYVESKNRIPWNLMTESSSDESITQYMNTIANKNTKGIETIVEQEQTSNSTNLEERNAIANKDSSECKSNLNLKRHQGTLSLGNSKMVDVKSKVSSNAFEIAVNSDSLVMPVLSEVQNENLTDEHVTHKSVSPFDNNRKKINMVDVRNDLKCKNSLEEKMDTVTKHKVLDEFTKLLDVSDNNVEQNEVNECSSPLTGRTVIYVAKNVTDFNNSNTKNLNEFEKEMTKSSTVDNTIVIGDNTSVDKENDGGALIPFDEDKSSQSLKETNYVKIENHEEIDSICLNNQKYVEKLESNLNSQSSSLYFSDKTSCSNVKLNVDANSNPNESETKETAAVIEKFMESAEASINITTNLQDQLQHIEECNGNIVNIETCDVKSFRSKETEFIKTTDSNCEKSSDSRVREENRLRDKRYTLNKLTDNTDQSMSNNINVNETIPRLYDEACNKDVETLNVTSNSNNSMLPKSKAQFHSLSSNINLSSNTSASYVDASNQDFTTLSNNSLMLEKSLSNPPSSRLEKSASNRPVHFSSTSVSSRLSWSPKKVTTTGNASTSKNKKQGQVVTEVENSKSPVSAKKDNPRTKQRSLKDCQLTARSNLSLTFSGHGSLTNETGERRTGKSSIELPQRRSRSYVTPRKSDSSPRNIDTCSKLKNDCDTSQSKVASQRSKTSDLTSRSSLKSHVPTPKTSSKSFIPVPRAKSKPTKKTECEPRSRSPIRNPLITTATNPSKKDFVREDQTAETVVQTKRATIESGDLKETKVSELIEESKESKDEVSRKEEPKEPCVALEKITFLEQTCPTVIPKECMVIYVNVMQEHEHGAMRLVNPNKFLKYVKDKELNAQNDDNQIEDCNKYDVRTSISILDCLEDKSNMLTVAPANKDENDFKDKNMSTITPFQIQRSAVSKLLSTSALRGSWSFRVNQREIEVSAKPSVVDISTSISDLPNIFQETENMADELKLKVFEVPKELTKEEYIALLETINKNPNLLQFRRMHKLCNKLGLGFRE